jgi:hypothetical protein
VDHGRALLLHLGHQVGVVAVTHAVPFHHFVRRLLAAVICKKEFEFLMAGL